jgi:hypothetical protein
MRAMFLIAAVTAAMLLDLRASQAYYGNGPWCAVESVGFSTVTEDCSMRTFEQCRLQTIAGNRGFAYRTRGGPAPMDSPSRPGGRANAASRPAEASASPANRRRAGGSSVQALLCRR